MIDLHTHVLPGLDDGARDVEQSLAMLSSMAAEGVRLVVATPHVRADFPTTPEAMLAALRDVQAAAAAAGLPVEVLPGGELSLATLDEAAPAWAARFGLGGNPRLLLLEFPYGEWPRFLERRVAGLRAQGIVPVLAHPERNGPVADDPGRLAAAVEAGAVVQLTAASVDGRLGRRSARCARRLLELGLAHVVASDAHGPGVREAGLAHAVESLGDPALARWLVEDVPAALLTDAELPRRPAARRRTRLLGRGR